MKKSLAYGLVFVIGSALGASAGFIYGKKKYEKMADKEILEMREDFLNKTEGLRKENEDLIKQVSSYNAEVKGNSPIDYYKNKVRETENGEDETPVTEDYSEEGEEDSKPEIKRVYNAMNKYGDQVINQQNNADPYVISSDDFGCNENYNIYTLYKTADGKIIDQENRIVNDYASIVGTDFYDELTFDNADCVYVRNETRMTDYEILLLEKTALEIGVTE